MDDWIVTKRSRRSAQEEMMAKDTDPFELNAAAKQAMEQAHQAVDTYFDFLKKSVSSFPSGGTDLGEKLKDQSLQNITAVHELVKRLSQARILKKRFEFRQHLCIRN